MSNNKRLKTRNQVTMTIDKELWKQFQKLSEVTRIPMSRIADEMIKDIIQKFREKGVYTDEDE